MIGSLFSTSNQKTRNSSIRASVTLWGGGILICEECVRKIVLCGSVTLSRLTMSKLEIS